MSHETLSFSKQSFYVDRPNRVFPFVVLILGELIWLLKLDKCFRDSGVYYL